MSDPKSQVSPGAGVRPIVVLAVLICVVALAITAAGIAAGLELAAAFASTGIAVCVAAILFGSSALLSWLQDRALHGRIASRPCPKCGALLGDASLRAEGPTVDLRFVTGIGALTSARCASCGARSEWTAHGELFPS